MKKKFLSTLLSLTLVGACLTGCGSAAEPAADAPAKTESAEKEAGAEAAGQESAAAENTEGKKWKVGFAQCSMNAPHRIKMTEVNMAYAKENYPEFDVILTDGEDTDSKQVSDVEDLIANNIDILLISPNTSEALTDVCQKAMDAGIPVVTLDRNVNCDVTCWIGAENIPMGVQSADLLAEMIKGDGKIIEVQGTAGASATIDRHQGFEDELKKYPNLSVIDTQYCNYTRADAMSYMEDMLQKFPNEGDISAVYCHNDEMAAGVVEAIAAAGRSDEGILVTGMDGNEEAFEYVDSGAMAFTVIYPTCAPEGMQAAYKILNGESVDKHWILDTTVVSKDNVKDFLGTGL
ncbi:MAG: ribose ABC transporter substrate-binding protein [Lachnospiraceae bacterium]|nr:ribose ABC transporter substrate-binding protein [Lachnospiraceae bacterium]